MTARSGNMAGVTGATPSFVLLDHTDRVRLNHFRQISDLELGAQISSLLAEPGTSVAR